MDIDDGDHVVVLRTASEIEQARLAEKRRLGPVRRITLDHETILGGIRIDPGTYELRCVDKPADDGPAF